MITGPFTLFEFAQRAPQNKETAKHMQEKGKSILQLANDSLRPGTSNQPRLEAYRDLIDLQGALSTFQDRAWIIWKDNITSMKQRVRDLNSGSENILDGETTVSNLRDDLIEAYGLRREEKHPLALGQSGTEIPHVSSNVFQGSQMLEGHWVCKKEFAVKETFLSSINFQGMRDYLENLSAVVQVYGFAAIIEGTTGPLISKAVLSTLSQYETLKKGLDDLRNRLVLLFALGPATHTIRAQRFIVDPAEPMPRGRRIAFKSPADSYFSNASVKRTLEIMEELPERLWMPDRNFKNRIRKREVESIFGFSNEVANPSALCVRKVDRESGS